MPKLAGHCEQVGSYDCPSGSKTTYGGQVLHFVLSEQERSGVGNGSVVLGRGTAEFQRMRASVSPTRNITMLPEELNEPRTATPVQARAYPMHVTEKAWRDNKPTGSIFSQP
jgi:hypothetical protein